MAVEARMWLECGYRGVEYISKGGCRTDRWILNRLRGVSVDVEARIWMECGYGGVN